MGQEADGQPTQSRTSSGRHRSINTSVVLAAEGTGGAHLQPLLRTPVNTQGLLSPRDRLCTALLPPPPFSPSPLCPCTEQGCSLTLLSLSSQSVKWDRSSLLPPGLNVTWDGSQSTVLQGHLVGSQQTMLPLPPSRLLPPPPTIEMRSHFR